MPWHSFPREVALQVALNRAQKAPQVLALALPQSFRVLLVWPQISRSFSAWEASTPSPGRKAYLPPLGLLTVAGLCPGHWHLKLVDEALQPVSDKELAWCDLIMISAMESQSQAVENLLLRARDAGRRSVVGGPYAASHTRRLAELADHVVVGEVEEHFCDIAEALEAGCAEAVYEIQDRPDIALAPTPRYDLLRLGAYTAMSLQSARVGQGDGPEFRPKPAQQILRELDSLGELGWKGGVFWVDEDFSHHPVRATEIAVQLKLWQERHKYPVYFCGQASSQLAHSQDLIEAMVEANFHTLLLAIQAASGESFQALRSGVVDSVGSLLQAGLWVKGGFLAADNSDDGSIWEHWHQLLEQASLPWVDLSPAASSGEWQSRAYRPQAYFRRALRSLELWRPRPPQTPAGFAWTLALTRILQGLGDFGTESEFRREFWQAFVTMVTRWCYDPVRLYHGFGLLNSSRSLLSRTRSPLASPQVREKPEPSWPVPV